MRLALVLDSPRKYGLDYLHQTVRAAADYAGRTIETRDFFVSEPQPGGKSPAIAVIRDNRSRLAVELADWAPDAVLSLGAAALNGLSASPTALAISKERGRMRWWDEPIRWVPSISHVAAMKNHDLHRDLVNDAYKVIHQLEPLPPMQIDVRVPTSVSELVRDLADLEGASVVGVDVETTGLRPYRDDLLAVGIGATYDDVSGIAVVVSRDLLYCSCLASLGGMCRHETADGFKAGDLVWDAVWRKSRRSVGHNFKFDMQFLAGYLGGIDEGGVMAWPPDEAVIGDTMLLAHLLDERPNHPTSRVRGLGLKDLVAVRYDHAYGFDFGTEITDDRLDEMHAYLAEDVVYTARLWHDLREEADAESSRLMEAHDGLLMPVSKAIARCEYAGAPIDVRWVQRTVREMDNDIQALRLRLDRELPGLVPRGYVLSPTFNVLAPAQVADVMYDWWKMTPDVRKHGRKKDGDRSTDRDHIKAAIAKYRDTPLGAQATWLEGLDQLRRDVKLKTTYQKSLLDRVDDDGRVRAGFLLHGTATGRLSSQGPNLQNVPAVDREGAESKRPMRRAFRPGPGRAWIEVDYSQLELRVAAGISGDRALTEVFRSGRDVHQEIASAIFAKPYEKVTKAERFLAKAVGFGIIYGRSAKALAGGAEMDYVERELKGKRWTEEQAGAFIRKFLKDYPQVDEWMQREYAEGPRRRYVESPFGRRRRFPLIPANPVALGAIQRQVVNTPVQSAASDICLEAMVELQRRFEAVQEDAPVVLFPVHDSICIEADERDVAEVEAICREVMEKDFMGVPLTVDFEYGPTWADTRKHTKAAAEERTMKHTGLSRAI